MLAAPSPARAQTAPNGSYLASCTGSVVTNNVLVASCRRADQTYVPAALPNPYSCADDISNRDGRLYCAARLSAPAVRTYSAKFEEACLGLLDYYIVVRWAGSPNDVIRMRLERGQKIHLQLPSGSTEAHFCGSWPDGNQAFNGVSFE
jgi:hypothetical protein